MNKVMKRQEKETAASNRVVDNSDSVKFLMKKPAKRRRTPLEKAADEKKEREAKEQRDNAKQTAKAAREETERKAKEQKDRDKQATKAAREEVERQAKEQRQAAREEAAAKEATSQLRQKKHNGKGKAAQQTKKKRKQPEVVVTAQPQTRVDRSGTKRCTECNTWLPVSQLDVKEKCLHTNSCIKRQGEGLGKRVRVAKKNARGM